LWYGSALIDESGEMIGSMYVVSFPTRKALDKYLQQEPYILGNVWKSIEIMKCTTRDPWQFNRPKEFFVNE
ncbi:MAG: hypothetical protein O3B87_01260, partial [bacterium]|nr:hypothetical protein [bacterium]